ncbi:duboraya [Festucalex cinctus]
MQEGRGRETEEQTAPRPSVAQLAGRFKGPSPPPPAGDTEKPVRRRPPRSLQLPKSHGDEQEKCSGVPSPVKAKRNSALIEKLQANLALSPAALLPSPKSPASTGFRPFAPFSPPPSPSPTAGSPSSTLTSPSPVSTSLPTGEEEEGPVSFEAPPTAAEGSLLMNVTKSRARHSLKRRPPSRRHRKSSSGEEVGVATEETDTPGSQPDHKTTQDIIGDGDRNHLKDDESEESPKDVRNDCDIRLRREEDDEKREKTSEEDPNNS